MSKQTDLFATGITCYICGQDPGRGRNGHLWGGFIDADTRQTCCNACKKNHYQLKANTKHKDLYSEMPVVIK